jgi:hypothetical protein
VPMRDARGGRPPHGGSRAARPRDGRGRCPRGRPTRSRRRRRRRRARRAPHPSTPRGVRRETAMTRRKRKGSPRLGARVPRISGLTWPLEPLKTFPRRE